MKFSRSDFEMQRFESRRPNQPVRLKQSIGEACRERVRVLLGAEREAEFKELYDARSKLVHEGGGRGENAQNAAKALLLATDFARAEIGYAR